MTVLARIIKNRAIPQKLRYLTRFSELTYKSNIRTILSDAYTCKPEWNSRFTSQALVNIKMDDFYSDLHNKMTIKGYIDAIDLDLFANNIKKEDQLYELEDLLHRFRRTPNTVMMIPSTPHAVIRSYLQFDKLDALLKLLQDKNNYGVFPDTFSYNILLDHFIKSNNFKDGVQIAILMMLQEDPGDNISQTLAMYTCHKYLQENLPPVPATYTKEEVQKAEESEDEEDVEWVRVHFLRKDYFDDHFDLKDETLLIGKTLCLFGKQFNDEISLSYQLLGLGMYQKWDQADRLLDDLLLTQNDGILSEDIVEKFKHYVAGDGSLEENRSREINEKLDKLKSSNRILSNNVDDLMKKKLDEVSQYSSNQAETYRSWNDIRMSEIKKQLNEYVRQERIKKIAAKKKEIKDKEDLLFFFENFHKLQRDLPDKKEEEKKKSTKYQEDYVVPEMPHPGFKSSS